MIVEDVEVGAEVAIPHRELVNLYGCCMGDRTRIGTFVEIQKGARIGVDCKIQSHAFICDGVDIGDVREIAVR
jgi:UDP-2-acetamido-3-amino-2,3-dideoxy-glucuronate N-acetyltransferase